MKIKSKIKVLVDIAMCLLFLYLLQYRPGMGLMLHAVGGLIMFGLFIVHHLLNINWYKTLFKGKYGLRRIWLAIVDTLLFLAMLGMMISSTMLSGMVFSFSIIQPTQIWRDVHLLSANWGFVIIAFHLGLHLPAVLKSMKMKFVK